VTRVAVGTDLFVRHEDNPILRPGDWPYPIHTAFNPGATRLPDGTTLLLCRCEDRRGFSHLSVARSADGVTDWRVEPEPVFLPDPYGYPEELYGVEDPRITFVAELGVYVVAYTAFGRSGPGVALATTTDFRRFERLGLVMQPDDKDAALFPRSFDGQFALIHRPTSVDGSHMWISYSRDLQNWGGHHLMLPARRGGWWDANKIGLATPPIRSDRGWIVLYHGVRRHASGSIYRVGLALFDLERPDVCLLRGAPWAMGPETPYETMGDVPYVVFPCGATVADDGDTVNVYYGAADSCIGLATTSIAGMLAWLDEHGTTMVGVAGTEIEREAFAIDHPIPYNRSP
jgi:Predicted glycosylase